jgi:hypothetical protein
MDKEAVGRADVKLTGAYRGCTNRLKTGFLNNTKTITYEKCADQKYRSPYRLQEKAIITGMALEERE